MNEKKVRGANRGIHRRNFVYYIIYPYVRSVFFHYYGKVQISGKENIPGDAPVIFAPNHQNALMDALIVLFSAPSDVVFLARADIFNKRLMAWFFNSLKILPVFRQRDGAAELVKNQEIFDISVDVLKNGHYLCIMPEGNHGDQRKLRTLVKGIFRIAFKAQEEAGRTPFVKIVPVGLDFSDYVKQNASLYINYGKPIEISEYWDEYSENNARGINAVKTRLDEDMRPLMIDIGTDEYYETVHRLREIFNPRMREILGIGGSKLSDRFRADKEMIVRLEEAIGKAGEKAGKIAGEESGKTATEKSDEADERIGILSDKVRKYRDGIEAMGIREWVVREKGYSFVRSLWRYLSLVITFPVFLYGFINNILPFWLPVRLVRKIKDLQFHSSVKAGLAILVLFPLFYFVQTLLVAILTGPWWIWVAYLVSLLPTGKAALFWYFRWKKTVRGSRFRRQLRKRKPEAWDLVNLRKEIIELTEEMVTSPSS